MRQEVPTWLVVVAVVIVLVIVGFVYWYSGRTKVTQQEQQQLPATHQPAPLPTAP